mmetsp:Transcript_28422/g.71392  ORF Transcript_28422/g.71392 Transcript_28422/m.71392 type:complete len:273 (-) Transcript_28422:102-920(-)
MGVAKKKRVRKHLHFYKMAYNFHPPYRVLVEASFLVTSMMKKIFLREELPRLLQDKAFPVVTKCIVRHLRTLGEEASGAALMAKRMEHVRCGHEDSPVSQAECILSLIDDSSQRLMVGNGDPVLARELNSRPGIPQVYIAYSYLMFQNPTFASKDTSIQCAQTVVARDQASAKLLKRSMGIEEDAGTPMPRKRKRRGANPLSCKKKKKVNKTDAAGAGRKGLEMETAARPLLEGGGSASEQGEKKSNRKRTRTRAHKKKKKNTEGGEGEPPA